MGDSNPSSYPSLTSSWTPESSCVASTGFWYVIYAHQATNVVYSNMFGMPSVTNSIDAKDTGQGITPTGGCVPPSYTLGVPYLTDGDCPPRYFRACVNAWGIAILSTPAPSTSTVTTTSSMFTASSTTSSATSSNLGTNTSPEATQTSSPNGLSTAAKGGIGAGAAVAALAIIGLIVWVVHLKRKAKPQIPPAQGPSTNYPEAYQAGGFPAQHGHHYAPANTKDASDAQMAQDRRKYELSADMGRREM
ncbi:hypothetical protein F4808DRAFT_468299 [Astrocystis sublimbata]|nr:hypothetical protein F4808DRAFT_468299 [Astrocystis sublimbata]